MRRIAMFGTVGVIAWATGGCGGSRHAAATRSVTIGGHSYPAYIVGVNAGQFGWWSYPPLSSGHHSPNKVALTPPSALSVNQKRQFRSGELVVGESGCLGCHVIGDTGNNGPGPPLTHVASRISRVGLESALEKPTAPMPSFIGIKQMYPERFAALVDFLSELR